MNATGNSDLPWAGDACSLVDAFRRGERSPLEELDATLAAVGRSELGAVCFTDPEPARLAAASADVTRPFGGVPVVVKELHHVAGWPATEASVVFADRVAGHTEVMLERLTSAGGAVLFGQATASEFGGVNLARTLLHGVTRNPWDPSRSPGGSSGGSAAAVAGGLCTLATGGDGGGSIRIPAGFCGLVGLKATYGRIPRAPHIQIGNYTVTSGCLTRSVRDTARWFDVTNGHDARDPFSLPRVEGWEAALGGLREQLRGLRVAVVPDWGGAYVAPQVWAVVEDAAATLIGEAGLRRDDGVDTTLPEMGAAWSLSGTLEIAAELGERWPACEELLTPQIRFALRSTEGRYDATARARIEQRRLEVNERMAEIFREVDLVLTASNPDVAFDAEGGLPSTFGGTEVGAANNGRLTFPANLHGNPAISVPAGQLDGLPVGLQIVGRHHHEQQLLELARLLEQARPWPLVAPGRPA